ncbi:MAG: histone deacetylase family protein [Candidimonas sp.]|nr:MAG: histone deacetylase family protein [Candidimonas sp.]
METLYITHPSCPLHEMGDWHPECPARLTAIHEQLVAEGLLDHLTRVQAIPATREQVLRIHTAEYVDYLVAHQPKTGYFPLDPDTSMNPHSLDAAWAAAGAGVTAVDAIMRGRAGAAFCAVRPPGHHACRSHAMGFCFFNNVAVAVAHGLQTHGLRRVAIIDFDVHHGNGTEEAFAGNPQVLMCSFYQHPFYPGRSGPAADNMVNVPVSAHTQGAEIRRIVTDVWLPRLAQFAPEFIFVSAGFDAHRDDDLAQLDLLEDDYDWLTRQVVAQADASAQGRTVSLLEGGYNLNALGRSAAAHVRALARL